MKNFGKVKISNHSLILCEYYMGVNKREEHKKLSVTNIKKQTTERWIKL